MASDDFDYRKPRIKIEELIPDYFRTDVTTAVLGNGANRFLTPDDTVYVSGTVGKKLTNVQSDNRIIENDPHRQAWQLQPLLYNKIATVDHIYSYNDILNKLTHLGVDTSRLPKWGSTEFFNYAPPVDIDKLINYQDYYWIEKSKPQYITIQNPSTIIKSRIIEKTKLYNSLVNTATPAELSALYNDIQSLFVQEQQLSATSTGWSSTLFDDNVGEWDIDNLWMLYGNTAPLGNATWDNEAGVHQNDWVSQNKWVHKSDLTNVSAAQMATMPIIEYNSNLELNEWTYTKHNWKYRKNIASAWTTTTSEPTVLEICGFLDITNILLDDVLSDAPEGRLVFVIPNDVTESLPVGYTFTVDRTLCNDGDWIVQKTEFVHSLNATLVYTVQDITYEAPNANIFDDIYGFDTPAPTSFLLTCPDTINTPSGYGIITPAITSLGDTWGGLYNHWMWVSSEDTVPTNHQSINQEQANYINLINVDGVQTLVLPFRYFVDIDNLQVYINGVRQYGNYIEVHQSGGTSDTITFTQPLATGSYVNIKTKPACVHDIGREMNWVRTETNEIEYKCLLRFRKHEQAKLSHTQYPLFDIYNTDGTAANKANSIFTFNESVTAAIDSRVDLRLNTLNNGTIMQFDQLLISDTGAMLCYKDFSTISSDNTTGLQTIWKHGNLYKTYTPRYVDQYRLADGDSYIDATGAVQVASVPLGSDLGAWEIPEQLYYNPLHENRKTLSYTQLYTHFRTIIAGQVAPVGYEQVSSSSVFKLLDNVEYGIGGTIREYNDSYGNFLSAIYQNNISPNHVITFANTQYDNCLQILKDTFIKSAAGLIQSTSNAALTDPNQTLINSVLLTYTQYNSQQALFSDSTAYDSVTNTGMPNWVATIPVLNILTRHKPIQFIDSQLGINTIKHHDGHISDCTLSTADYNTIVKNIISVNGSSHNTNPSSIIGVVKGHFWYNTTSKQLWRYNVIDIGTNTPPVVGNTGAYWFNNISGLLYTCDATSWVVEPNHSKAWDIINITQLYADVILTVENKLYERAATTVSPKLDFNKIITDSDDAAVFYDKLHECFKDYAKSNNLDPYYVDYTITDAFTWNYRDVPASEIIFPNTNTSWGARWYTIYEALYNTPYPHMEPWRLQNFDEKPTWWDSEYKDITGLRRWTDVMWANIKTGVVPSAYTAPAIIPTYTHVCVNITNNTIDGYAPDSLLPPYYTGDLLLEQEVLIRSATIVANILPLTQLPYDFGDQGHVERMWRTSSNYRYSIILSSFQLQPIQTFKDLFGCEFFNINGLDIEKTTNTVIPHTNTYFHGDIINNQITKVNGINQWYVNALRFGDYDSVISDFRPMWINWEPKLTYQVNSAINTRTLNVSTKFYPVSDIDYNVYLKRVPAVDDYWVSSLLLTVQDTGSVSPLSTNTKIPLGRGEDWNFRVDIPVNIGKSLNFYDVNSYNITAVNDVTNTFTVDRPTPWTTGTEIQLLSNIRSVLYAAPTYLIKVSDVEYKLATAYTSAVTQLNDVNVYDSIQVVTTANENTIPVDFTDGTVWIYTDSTTSTTMIKQYNALNGMWVQYSTTRYIFRVPPATIESNIKIYNGGVLLISGVDYTVYNDWVEFLIDPISIPLTIRLLLAIDTQVYELFSSFMALGGAHSAEVWQHYSINKTRVNTVAAPLTIRGVQNVINFIDGYAAYAKNSGFIFNDLALTDVDEDTNLIISWDAEVEKAVDKIYQGFNSIYNTTSNGVIVNYDFHEINPFKYNIWLQPARGVVSNVITGPFSDIRIQPIIFNQNGDPIQSIENLKIYRNDKVTRIMYPHVVNATDTNHISGMHLYVDTYEHVLMFNNYTIDGNLVYDPYIGMNISKIHLDFKKHYEATGRPNLGGHVLSDNKLIENIEYNAQTLRNFYDTYNVDENTKHLDYVRSLLNYQPGSLSYLTDVGINDKSKFLFWRGMIQHKGSNQAVDAFVNSRQFEDITLDEFWAYKVAEFGNNSIRNKPLLKLKPADVTRGSLRYHFTNTDDVIDATFTEITKTDVERWNNLPDNIDIQTNNMFFDADLEVSSYINAQYHGQYYTELDVIADNVIITFDNDITFKDTFIPVEANPIITVSQPFIMGTSSLVVYVNGEAHTDFTELTTNTIQLNAVNPDSVIVILFKTGLFVNGVHYTQVNAQTIKWNMDISAVQGMICYCVKPNLQHTSGMRLISNNIVVSELPLWDPARGVYDVNVNLNVNSISSVDPAIYQYDIRGVVDETLTSWSSKEVGYVWVDTDNIAYVPYYDTAIFNNISSVLSNWGKIPEWCTPHTYEWVESDVLPIDWNTAVEQQKTTLIEESVKLSGTPYTVPCIRFRANVDDVWGDWELNLDKHLYVKCHRFITSTGSIIIDVNTGNANYLINNNLIINEVSDVFNVYRNEIKLKPFEYTVSSTSNIIDTITIHSVNEYDSIRIVLSAFTPDDNAIDGINNLPGTLKQYINQYPSCQRVVTNDTGTATNSKFYFWVRNKTNRVYDNNVALMDIDSAWRQPVTPYVIIRHVQPATDTLTTRYTQLVVNNVSSYINDGADYTLLLQRDGTLRGDIHQNNIIPMNLHNEWKMIRPQQMELIPRVLWDKITETMLGHTILDANILIPSTTRVLFDNINSTTTRYGFENDQAVGDKNIITKSIVARIEDSNFDIHPINKETLLEAHTFDTPNNIIEAMNYMYITLDSAVVNALFFGALQDALTFTHQLDGIFKTSMLAIHSTRRLVTARDVIDD